MFLFSLLTVHTDFRDSVDSYSPCTKTCSHQFSNSFFSTLLCILQFCFSQPPLKLASSGTRRQEATPSNISRVQTSRYNSWKHSHQDSPLSTSSPSFSPFSVVMSPSHGQNKRADRIYSCSEWKTQLKIIRLFLLKSNFPQPQVDYGYSPKYFLRSRRRRFTYDWTTKVETATVHALSSTNLHCMHRETGRKRENPAAATSNKRWRL